ncbi:hypothetical protein [Bacillus sp. AFS031507]|uniref:hypothetical protein n=1 Tax=Bacillus sp. AFS031507 TaxID=2033496 RepID=UPI000BFB9978|nr:hypothetical protein [Bacillus sp. AFS031507]PGY06709.1 hypothetical protein COE25_26580 [Bacillus sp. AFS031507]
MRLLYDGLGSLELSKSFIQELKDANVEINVYSTITNAFFNKKLNIIETIEKLLSRMVPLVF